MNRGLKTHKKGQADDYYTPTPAIEILLPWVSQTNLIWEPAVGEGHILKVLAQNGYRVFGTDIKQGTDFLTDDPQYPFDAIITNPPYSLKNEWIARCYELGKPFALLMPISALESAERQHHYKTHGIELLIPNKRIQCKPANGKSPSPPYLSAWFCWRLLPQQIIFTELA